MPDSSPLLSPLAPAPNLTSGLVERLTFEIESGKLAPGSRLPTEQALINAIGVSRTVVREAISALARQWTRHHAAGGWGLRFA
jgi:GntR family transcriptional repressor for pyruvate dehydrogenase complex